LSQNCSGETRPQFFLYSSAGKLTAVTKCVD